MLTFGVLCFGENVENRLEELSQTCAYGDEGLIFGVALLIDVLFEQFDGVVFFLLFVLQVKLGIDGFGVGDFPEIIFYILKILFIDS